jgi:CMP-N,N'-diacetyllegionaminic acid synthase
MKHVAIIPARHGSKSIPNKNLQKLGSKSLVHLAIDQALESGSFHRIILSTDIPILVEEFQNHPVVELRARPSLLALDSTLMGDVVQDTLDTMKVKDRDWIWLLQPTSPFRKLDHFSTIQSMMRNETVKSVISVKDVGPNHPNRTYTIHKGELKPLRYTNFSNKQELLPVYIRNGCFYICQAGDFRKAQSFYVPRCIPYPMLDEDSINIDGPLDLILAQAVAKR